MLIEGGSRIHGLSQVNRTPVLGPCRATPSSTARIKRTSPDNLPQLKEQAQAKTATRANLRSGHTAKEAPGRSRLRYVGWQPEVSQNALHDRRLVNQGHEAQSPSTTRIRQDTSTPPGKNTRGGDPRSSPNGRCISSAH